MLGRAEPGYRFAHPGYVPTMKILAISDIHNNVACVRKLRAQETNDYAVIAIPGDIGSDRAAEIFGTLRTFKCPIVYVHGNWDRMSEDAKFGARTHLVHLKVVKVGRLAFAGYSFSGPLPKPLDRAASYAEYTRRCRSLLSAAIRKSGVDLRRCVLMTHDRATHLDREFPNLLLHIYGHIHTFDVLQRAGTTYVNTSALDRILPVALKRDMKRLRYVNAGNYAVIEVDKNGKISVECRILRRNYEEWSVMGRHSMWNGPMGGDLFPGDAVFGDNVRFPDAAAKVHSRRR
jgi:Icc-related predicted phosphoesterase